MYLPLIFELMSLGHQAMGRVRFQFFHSLNYHPEPSFQSYFMTTLQVELLFQLQFRYHKVASSNTSCLVAHAGFFRLHMKGIFNPYGL
jgi:hypothetical protein